jgi:hypothetical protein
MHLCSYFKFRSNSQFPQDRNIILTHAFEYRFPPSPVSASPTEQTEATEPTARYLGQVVVPGPHISKIELDEFVSQVRSSTSANVTAGVSTDVSGAVAASEDEGASASASAEVV